MKKTLKVGIISAACIYIVFFLFGLIFNNFQIKPALEVVKNVLLLISALLMFILAGMIMIKGKKPDDKIKLSKFQFALIILIILLFAIITDYIIFYI